MVGGVLCWDGEIGGGEGEGVGEFVGGVEGGGGV